MAIKLWAKKIYEDMTGKAYVEPPTPAAPTVAPPSPTATPVEPVSAPSGSTAPVKPPEPKPLPEDTTATEAKTSLLSAFTPKNPFPTVWRDEDTITLEKEAKRLQKLEELYNLKFPKNEPWYEAVAKRSLGWMAGLFSPLSSNESLRPEDAWEYFDEWGIYSAIIPEQAQVFMQNTIKNYGEIYDKKLRTEAIPTIEQTLLLFALRGKPIKNFGDAVSRNIPAIGMEWSPEERKWLEDRISYFADTPTEDLMKAAAKAMGIYQDPDQQVTLPEFVPDEPPPTPLDILLNPAANQESAATWETEQKAVRKSPSFLRSTVAFSRDIGSIVNVLQQIYKVDTETNTTGDISGRWSQPTTPEKSERQKEQEAALAKYEKDYEDWVKRQKEKYQELVSNNLIAEAKEVKPEAVTDDEFLAEIANISKAFQEEINNAKQLRGTKSPDFWTWVLNPALPVFTALNAWNNFLPKKIAGLVLNTSAELEKIGVPAAITLGFFDLAITKPNSLSNFVELHKKEMEAGLNFWDALEPAYDKFEMPWGVKMLLETVYDPLTYVGVGLFGKLEKFGRVGATIAKIDSAIGKALNLPFDLIIKAANKLPKFPAQYAIIEARKAEQLTARLLAELAPQVGGKQGVSWTKMTTAQVLKALKIAVEHGAEETASPAMKQMREYLLDIQGVTERDMVRLSKTLGSNKFLKVEDVTPHLLEEVWTRLEAVLYKGVSGTQDEAVRLVLDSFGVNATEDAVKAVLNFTHKMSMNSVDFIDKLASKNVFDIMKAIGAKVEQDWLVALKTPNPKFADSSLAKIGAIRQQRAAVGSWSVKASQAFLNFVIVRKLGDWLIRPAAKLYLGFSSYFIFNIVENYFRGMIGGYAPRFKSSSWMLKNRGHLASPIRWYQEVSDTAGMGMMRPVAITERDTARATKSVRRNIAERMKELATGDFWIRGSSHYGAMMRNDYIEGRFQHHLAEILGKGGTGIDDIAKFTTSFFDEFSKLKIDGRLRRSIKKNLQNVLASGNPEEAARSFLREFEESFIKKNKVSAAISKYGELEGASRLLYYADHEVLLSDLTKAFDEAFNLDLQYRMLQGDEIAFRYNLVKQELSKIPLQTTEDLYNAYHNVAQMLHEYNGISTRLMAFAQNLSEKIPHQAGKQHLWNEFFDSIEGAMRASGSTIQDILNTIRVQTSNITSGQIKANLDAIYNVLDAQKALGNEMAMKNLEVRTRWFVNKEQKLKTNEDWMRFYADIRANVYEAFAGKKEQLAIDYEKTMGEVARNSGFSQQLPPKDFTGATILSPDDLAYIFDCQVNNVSRQIMQNAYLQSEEAFTALVMAKAERYGHKGVTKEAARESYRNLWKVNTGIQSPAMQGEMGLIAQKYLALRQELEAIRRNVEIPTGDRQILEEYFNKKADELHTLFGDVTTTPPKYVPYNYTPHPAGTEIWDMTKAEYDAALQTLQADDIARRTPKPMNEPLPPNLRDYVTTQNYETPEDYLKTLSGVKTEFDEKLEAYIAAGTVSGQSIRAELERELMPLLVEENMKRMQQGLKPILLEQSFSTPFVKASPAPIRPSGLPEVFDDVGFRDSVARLHELEEKLNKPPINLDEFNEYNTLFDEISAKLHDAGALRDDAQIVAEKIRIRKKPNSVLAETDLRELEIKGYDTSEAEDALRAYRERKRGKNEYADVYREDKQKLWDAFIETLPRLQGETENLWKARIKEMEKTAVTYIADTATHAAETSKKKAAVDAMVEAQNKAHSGMLDTDKWKKAVEDYNASLQDYAKYQDELSKVPTPSPTDFATHRAAIEEAINAGHNVPSQVLAEYPDLMDLEIALHRSNITAPEAINHTSPKLQSLLDAQQQAMDLGMKDFHNNFPRYDIDNALFASLRWFFPYWNYEWQRPAYLLNMMLTKPVTAMSWARYTKYNEEDKGYFRLFKTPWEFNPLQGTVLMGGMFGLMSDQPNYFDDNPVMNGAMDTMQRVGFFPNIAFQLAYNCQSMDKAPQFGDMIPAPIKTWLLIAEQIPFMTDTVSHFKKTLGGRFTQYQITNRVSEMCAQQRLDFSGAMVYTEVQNGNIKPFEGKEANAHIYTLMDSQDPEKRATGLKLKKMLDLWETASKENDTWGIVQSQLTFLRYYPEEREAARKERKALLLKLCNIDEKTYAEITRNGYKITDYIGRGFTPEERELIEALDYELYWSGTSTALLPQQQQEYLKTTRDMTYWYSEHRQALSAKKRDLDMQLADGKISRKTWQAESDALQTEERGLWDAMLVENKQYAGIPKNLKERVELFKKYGLPLDDSYPQPAALYLLQDLYFGIEDEIPDIYEPDDDGNLVKRKDYDAVRAKRAMIDQIAKEWGKGDAWEKMKQSKYSSPYQEAEYDVYDEYLQSYYRINDVVQKNFKTAKATLGKTYNVPQTAEYETNTKKLEDDIAKSEARLATLKPNSKSYASTEKSLAKKRADLVERKKKLAEMKQKVAASQTVIASMDKLDAAAYIERYLHGSVTPDKGTPEYELIANFNKMRTALREQMRKSDPELDYWLWFFNDYAPKTEAAAKLIKERGRDLRKTKYADYLNKYPTYFFREKSLKINSTT